MVPKTTKRTDDPVLVANGQTYELAAIKVWFQKQYLEIRSATIELVANLKAWKLRLIIEQGVRSHQ
jgi:hypothetical protein